MNFCRVVDEESDRLNLLVSRATEMAQLESQAGPHQLCAHAGPGILPGIRHSYGGVRSCLPAQHSLEIDARISVAASSVRTAEIDSERCWET